MARLSTKVGVVSLSRILFSVALVLASAVLARRLEPARYGTFQQAWLVVTVTTSLLLSGMPLAVYYFVPREPREGRPAFLRLLLATLGAAGAAGALLLLLLSARISAAFHNPELGARLPILAAFVALGLPATVLESFLIAENRHGRLARIASVASLAFLAAAVAPPLAGLDPAWLYAGLAASAALRTALLLGAVLAEYRGVAPRLSPGLPRAFLAYAAPLGVNEVLRVSSTWLDKTLVSAWFDPETYAIYANGAFEIPLVGILLASVTSVLLPEFSRLGKEGDARPILALWERAIRRTGLVLFPLFAFATLFARDIVVLLFSERYEASALPFRVYLLLLPLRAAAYAPILLALGRSRTVVLGALGDLLLSLGLASLLAPRIGYVGPAAAAAISTYAQVLFYLVATARALRVGLGPLFPWRAIGRLLAFSLIAAAPLAALAALPLAPGARLATAAPAYLALLLTASRTGLLPADERAFLADLARDALLRFRTLRERR